MSWGLACVSTGKLLSFFLHRGTCHCRASECTCLLSLQVHCCCLQTDLNLWEQLSWKCLKPLMRSIDYGFCSLFPHSWQHYFQHKGIPFAHVSNCPADTPCCAVDVGYQGILSMLGFNASFLCGLSDRNLDIGCHEISLMGDD